MKNSYTEVEYGNLTPNQKKCVIQKDSTYVPTCVKEDSGINVWWVYGIQIAILVMIIVLLFFKDEKNQIIIFWIIVALIVINMIALLFNIQGNKIVVTECKVSNKDCFDYLTEICINDSTVQPKQYGVIALIILIALFGFAVGYKGVFLSDKQKTSILKPGEPCMCAKEYSEAFKDYMCVPSSDSNV
jgi:hypothetical protein